MHDCDTCIYNPPSVLAGKPCCICDPEEPLLNCYQHDPDCVDDNEGERHGENSFSS